MASLISEIIVACVAILGALFALFRWVGHVDENTKATERLTAAFEKFAPRVIDQLADHEVRITVLERTTGDD